MDTRREPSRKPALRRATTVVLALVVVSVAAIAFIRLGQGVAVQARPVLKGDVELTADGPAIVTPVSAKVVAAATDGTVLSLNVADGSRVEPGQVLAELGNDALRKQRDDARVQTIVARAEHASERAAIGDTLSDAEAELFRARKDVATAQARFTAESALHERGIVGALQLGERRSELDLAEQSLQLAERRLARATESGRARQDAADARLQLARDAHAALDAEMQALTINAPMSGTVTALSIKPGQAISRGAAIAEINSPELKIEISVLEALAADLASGQSVILEGPNGRLSARVTQVGATPSKGMIKVSAALASEAPPWLRAGQTLDARIAIETAADSTYVAPPVGVQPNATSLAYVIRRGSDTAERTRIRWGKVTNTAAIIIEGADPGDEVLAYVPQGYESRERFRVAR